MPHLIAGPRRYGQDDAALRITAAKAVSTGVLV